MKEITLLPNNATDLIKEINDYRSFIVHKIFQNNIISENLSKSETVNNYIETRLVAMTNNAIGINRIIIEVIELYRNDLRTYKTQVGLSDSK